MKNIVSAAAIVLLFIGCKSGSGPVSENAMSFDIHGLPPSRPGEVYVIWAEVPPGGIAPSRTMHGTNRDKLFAKFTVDQTGKIIGLDTTKATANIGVAYNLINLIEISVERQDIPEIGRAS